MGRLVELWRLENPEPDEVFYRMWVEFGAGTNLGGGFVLRVFPEFDELDYCLVVEVRGPGGIITQTLYPSDECMEVSRCGYLIKVRAVEHNILLVPSRVLLEFEGLTDKARRQIKRVNKR